MAPVGLVSGVLTIVGEAGKGSGVLVISIYPFGFSENGGGGRVTVKVFVVRAVFPGGGALLWRGHGVIIGSERSIFRDLRFLSMGNGFRTNGGEVSQKGLLPISLATVVETERGSRVIWVWDIDLFSRVRVSSSPSPRENVSADGTRGRGIYLGVKPIRPAVLSVSSGVALITIARTFVVSVTVLAIKQRVRVIPRLIPRHAHRGNRRLEV